MSTVSFRKVQMSLTKRSLPSIRSFIIVLVFIAVIYLLLHSETAFAQLSGGGSGFETKMKNLQDKFLNVLLPIMAVFGMGYAGFLAATGNEGAKGRIVLCIIGAAVAFLAPYIIAFIRSALG